MCGPVAALTGLSGGLGAISSIGGGKGAAAAAKYNARQALIQGQLARQQADYEAARNQEDADQAIGAAKANVGASGIALQGSALDVIAQSSADAALDSKAIRRQGRLQQLGYQAEAQLQRSQGRAAKREGIFGAGTSLLTAAGNWTGSSEFSRHFS